MFDPLYIVFVILLYMGALFVIARQAEKRITGPFMRAAAPYVYALSLGVYCTAWSFYGGAGAAFNGGILFATTFLGPAIGAALWWTVLRRLTRIKSVHHITSIADFISARYGKSGGLAALAAGLAGLGTLPYIALQLKSVIQTYAIITGDQARLTGVTDAGIGGNVGPYIVLLMIVFTIAFGIRRLDPTERHPGMMTAVAVESLVKLAALLFVAGLAVYHVHDGPADMLARLAEWPYDRLAGMPGRDESAYLAWASYLLLAMAAFVFLPRQFHAAVIENSDERHILTAIRLLPLYLFLFALCVIPVATAGLSLGIPAHMADTYLLRIPLESDSPWGALLAFLGGFAASSGMVMVGTMTMSTMFTNHLLQPALARTSWLPFFRRHMLLFRRLSAAGIVAAGYLMERSIGDAYALANFGLIAFTAALQFAPPILAGLFWRRANKGGAMLGLSLGGLFWLHTMLLPAFAKSGLIWSRPLYEGLFGTNLLNPEHIFGISGMDPVTHSMFWSLIFNIGGVVLGSLYFMPDREERERAREFVDVLLLAQHGARQAGDLDIVLERKRGRVINLLSQYYPRPEAEALVDDWISRVGLGGRLHISVIELAELYAEVERHLAGAIGAAAAHSALSAADIFTVSETMELSEAYGGILAELKLAPDDLIQKIDYYVERETMLTRHADELARQVREKEKEIAERIRVEDALRRAERNYRDIFENAMEGIFQSTPSGLFVAANPTMARILGYDNPDDLCDTVIDAASQVYADQPDRERLQDEVRDKGRIESFETRLRRKNGGVIWASINMRAVLGPSGGIVYYEGSVQDITTRRAAEEEIRRLNEELEQRVVVRTQQLQSANKDLSQALETLQQTQAHLVQSEKMAALGGLVAGVAHEVNTPVGVGVTAASHLESCTKKILESRRAKNLTSGDLDAYLDTASEATAMILQNLRRAADLIRSFKMVAVDQSSQERRAFDLGRYVEEVLLSLRPKLRKTRHTVTVNCPPALAIDSYPGVFSQIITNLVMNSLHHAFSDSESGKIFFDITLDNDYLLFQYRDNGKGIAPEVLNRIFDPFFTTNRSKGGTGLGLHILYNLVTQTLGGAVTCTSLPGQGVTFSIKIPLSELKRP